MYYCNVCNRELKTMDTMYIHHKSLMHKDNLKSIEKKKQFLYHCETCNYHTNLKASFKVHETAKYHINCSGLKCLV